MLEQEGLSCFNALNPRDESDKPLNDTITEDGKSGTLDYKFLAYSILRGAMMEKEMLQNDITSFILLNTLRRGVSSSIGNR